jgi:SagB-type dehydrogenase family enzyme
LAAVREQSGLPETTRPSPTAPAAKPPRTKRSKAAGGPGHTISIRDEVTTECVLGTDLLVDIRREFKISTPPETPKLLSDDVCPMLMPRARTYIDEDGALRFRLPAGEPDLEQQPHCVVMRKTDREVAVEGKLGTVWQLIRAMDGARSLKEVLSEIPIEARPAAASLLARLASAGVVDVSGRPMGRFLHAATKKGVLLGGGLASDAVLRLATDGNYRTYREAPHIALAEAVPERLGGFHTLTRARRSRRDYTGKPLRREDFDALLHTACGVTGAMPWEGRVLKLRAYPSSGALYAVEVYPVVLRVEGLEPGVYHYAVGENALDAVKPGIDTNRFVGAALPVERQMVSGAAAMICLVGEFPRHERKYGEGGYRMMVAEAGHISQNLVLAATGLGIAARPFGGVFDGLINRELGLDEASEQYLLSVLIGHADGGDGEAQPEDKS